jgi:hypothetical protein
MVKKNCEVWREMGLLGPDSDPANQLLLFLTRQILQSNAGDSAKNLTQ